MRLWFLGLFQCMLLVLYLLNIIYWDWWLVLAPTLLSSLVIIVAHIVVSLHDTLRR